MNPSPAKPQVRQLPIPYEQEIIIEKVMAHVSKPELDRKRRDVLAFLNQPRA